MSQLHVELVDALLALAKVEEKDRAFVRDYFVDVVANADATALAHRVLTSVVRFLESRSSFSDLQRRVIAKLLEELLDQYSAGTAGAIRHDQTVSKTSRRLLDVKPSTTRITKGRAHDDLVLLSSTPADAKGHAKDQNTGPAIPEATAEEDRRARHRLQKTSGVTASRMKSRRIHDPVDKITQDVGNVSLNVPAPFSGNTSQKEPIPKLGRDLEKVYPFGHKLMSSFGWSADQGLGPDGAGIKQPIHTVDMLPFHQDISNPAGIGHPDRKNQMKHYDDAGHVTPQSNQETCSKEKETEDEDTDDYAWDWTNKNPEYAAWGWTDSSDTVHPEERQLKEFVPEGHIDKLEKGRDSAMQIQPASIPKLIDDTVDDAPKGDSTNVAQRPSAPRRKSLERYTVPFSKRRAGVAPAAERGVPLESRKGPSRGKQRGKQKDEQKEAYCDFDDSGEPKPNLYDQTYHFPIGLKRRDHSPGPLPDPAFDGWPEEEYTRKNFW